MLIAYFTSHIVFDRDGMNLESGIFFSDEGMTHSISDMMPAAVDRRAATSIQTAAFFR